MYGFEQRIAEKLKEIPESWRREFATYGAPEEIGRQIQAFRDAGIEYEIVRFEPEREREELKLFAEEAVRKF